MPTPTTYSYSVSQDFPNGTVNLNNLQNAIRQSAISVSLTNIGTLGDVLSINFSDVLTSGDRTILDGETGTPYGTHPAGGLISTTNSTRPPPPPPFLRYNEVIATADTTTTSTADVLVGNMTITPVPGTYMVWFTGSIGHSATSANIFTSIYFSGTFAGTVSITNGSATVTGTNTFFNTWFQVGDQIQFTSQAATLYTILSITSDMVLTLTANYGGTTNTSTTINLRQDGSSARRWNNGSTSSAQIVQAPFTSIAVVTVNGSQAIEGRWRTSGSTATMHQRSLLVFQVG
jgi:hypothetical protein